MAHPAGLDAALRATLVLIRHGQSTWVAEGRFQGRGDPPLSSLGRRQAALVAARIAAASVVTDLPLPGVPPVGVWYSPLERAAATAGPIAAALSATAAAARRSAPLLRANDGLLEIDQGEWQGLSHHEVRARWAPTLAAWRADPTAAHAPGGERLTDAHQRVRLAISGILQEMSSAATSQEQPPRSDTAEGPCAIVVAHDGVLRLAFLTILGVPIERFWSFPFALCAISVVEIADGRGVLRAHNLTDHLAPLGAADVGTTAGSPGVSPSDRGGAL